MLGQGGGHCRLKGERGAGVVYLRRSKEPSDRGRRAGEKVTVGSVVLQGL